MDYISKSLLVTVDGEVVRTENNFTGEWYACVGLHHRSQRIRINFGASPFKFNIKERRDVVAQTRLAQIDAVSAPPFARLIYNFLLFHGYKESAEAFCATKPDGLYPLTERDSTMLSTLDERAQIRVWFEEGQFSEVKEHLIARYGADAEASEASFLLDCLIFIDLVRKGETEMALEFAQTTFNKWWCEATHERIEDCCTLLAYYDPRLSPASHLLSTHHRDMTFKFLNRCILMWTGAIPTYVEDPIQHEPDLNQVMGHLNMAQAQIRNHRKAGLPFDISQLFQSNTPS